MLYQYIIKPISQYITSLTSKNLDPEQNTLEKEPIKEIESSKQGKSEGQNINFNPKSSLQQNTFAEEIIKAGTSRLERLLDAFGEQEDIVDRVILNIKNITTGSNNKYCNFINDIALDNKDIIKILESFGEEKIKAELFKLPYESKEQFKKACIKYQDDLLKPLDEIMKERDTKIEDTLDRMKEIASTKEEKSFAQYIGLLKKGKCSKELENKYYNSKEEFQEKCEKYIEKKKEEFNKEFTNYQKSPDHLLNIDRQFFDPNADNEDKSSNFSVNIHNLNHNKGFKIITNVCNSLFCCIPSKLNARMSNSEKAIQNTNKGNLISKD